MPKITAAATTSSPMKARWLRPRRPSRSSAALTTEDTTGPHREGNEQHAERNCRRPGRAEERRRHVLDDAERHGGDHHAGKAAEPAQHADRENAADIFAADRRLDRLDDDHGRAAERRCGETQPEGDALDL